MSSSRPHRRFYRGSAKCDRPRRYRQTHQVSRARHKRRLAHRPPVSLPPQAGTHRILHIHRNIPGILGQINSRLSKRGLNITGQYLNTNPDIGYVILDVESKVSKEAFEILRNVKGTIRARMVY
jgi:hypothetical protein